MNHFPNLQPKRAPSEAVQKRLLAHPDDLYMVAEKTSGFVDVKREIGCEPRTVVREHRSLAKQDFARSHRERNEPAISEEVLRDGARDFGPELIEAIVNDHDPIIRDARFCETNVISRRFFGMRAVDAENACTAGYFDYLLGCHVERRTLDQLQPVQVVAESFGVPQENYLAAPAGLVDVQVLGIENIYCERGFSGSAREVEDEEEFAVMDADLDRGANVSAVQLMQRQGCDEFCAERRQPSKHFVSAQITPHHIAFESCIHGAATNGRV
jgi:hypothetical protein